MKTKNVYGVELTSIEAMQFNRHRSNNAQIPAFNTISKEERTRIVKEWVDKQRSINHPSKG